MTDLIDKLIKLLPVKTIYEDAAQPAVQEAGKIAEELVKTLHLVLAPVQYTSAIQEKFYNFLSNSVNKVPEGQRIAPPSQILGPVLEGMKFEPDGTKIYEMFEDLLANAMDRDSVQFAHPSYPKIIQQLSHDEAVILSLLAEKTFPHRSEADLVEVKTRTGTTNKFINHRRYDETFPLDKLNVPERFSFYTMHLHVLGLAAFYDIDDNEYLRDDKGRQIGIKTRHVYRLKGIGRDFVDACQRK